MFTPFLSTGPLLSLVEPVLALSAVAEAEAKRQAPTLVGEPR